MGKMPELHAAPHPMALSTAARLRRSHVLVDAKGGILGVHETIVFPGGAEPDGSDAADALEIEPARRAGIAVLRHEGEVETGSVLQVASVAGRTALKAVKSPPPQPIVRGRGSR